MSAPTAGSPADRDAAGGSPISTMLGSTRYQDTALSVADQGSTADPIGAPEDPTTESQRLVFDEIAGSADLIESYAICLREAARRDDRDRVHAYLGNIATQFISARDAYYRIRELAKLRGPQ